MTPDHQFLVNLPSFGGKLDEFRSQVTAWACNIDYIRAVILFGSRAKGTAREDSDWDICCIIDGKKTEAWYGIWVMEATELKEQFCAVTGLSPAIVQFTAPTSEQVLSDFLNVVESYIYDLIKPFGDSLFHFHLRLPVARRRRPPVVVKGRHRQLELPIAQQTQQRHRLPMKSCVGS